MFPVMGRFVETASLQTIYLMCTSTASFQSPIEASKPVKTLQAQFPYKHAHHLFSIDESHSRKKSSTFKSLKMNQWRERLHKDLLLERSQWRSKEENKKLMENLAALLIQRIFRGHITRQRLNNAPIPPFLTIKRKNTSSTPQLLTILRQDLREELQELAASLHLKPLPGLSLDAISKRTRFRNSIETAAAIQLQCFVRLCMARRKRRAWIAQRARGKVIKASTRVAQFFRTVTAMKEREMQRRQKITNAAVKIQSHARRMLAVHKVRLLRQLRTIARREEEANIKLVRTFRRLSRISSTDRLSQILSQALNSP